MTSNRTLVLAMMRFGRDLHRTAPGLQLYVLCKIEEEKMIHTRFVVPFVLGVAVAALAGGCCNCSDMAKTTASREGFIKSYNDSAPSDCELASVSSDLKDVTLTCTEQRMMDIEAMVVAACMGYEMVGFEKITIVGKDGSSVCDITSGCSCSAQ